MARIALTCGCGWNFFIPGSTPEHEVTCPSCGQPVAIPGRRPGEVPLTPGGIAARLQQRAAIVRAALMLVGIAVFGGAAFLALKGTPRVEEPPPPKAEPRPTRGLTSLPPLPPSGPQPASPSGAQIARLRRSVTENVDELNMTAIVSECLRLRNLAREWSQMQASVAALAKQIKDDQAELAAAKQQVALGPTFAEGDRIVAFGSRDFSLLRRVDAARVLDDWLKAWRAGGAMEQVQVLRDERPVTLTIQFLEETKELLRLARHPSLQLEPLADREPAMAAPLTQPVEKAVELIAIDVLQETPVVSAVISEMRRRTEPMTTALVPIWPDESVRAIALIQDPLTFQPGRLPAAAHEELGKWWAGLHRDDRLRFATYFGLWCAHTRGKAAKK
jgi:hypothetical protein